MSFQNSELFELFRNSDNENAFKLAIVERLHDLPGYHEEDVKHIIHFAYLTIKKKNGSPQTVRRNSLWKRIQAG